MTHDLAVLFMYHADDPATRNNLAAVRHFNPKVPVLPICNWGTALGDGFHCRHMIRGWRRVLPSYRGGGFERAWNRFNLRLDKMWVWRNVDLVAYLWSHWKKRPVRARRWVMFEWDIYCNTSLLDFYAPSWDQPVVSTSIQVPDKNPEFASFNDNELRRMPESLHPYRMASNPWAGMLFADDALAAIADRVRTLHYCNGFCELRAATVAHSLGLTPSVNANPLAQQTLRSVTNFRMENVDKPSVWHRMKLNDGPARTPRHPV